MKNLPEGMRPDRDNAVYFDTEKWAFYMIKKWVDTGNADIPQRTYLNIPVPMPRKTIKFQE